MIYMHIQDGKVKNKSVLEGRYIYLPLRGLTICVSISLLHNDEMKNEGYTIDQKTNPTTTKKDML